MSETIMGTSYELRCFFEDGLLVSQLITEDLELIIMLKRDWLSRNPGSNFAVVCKVTREIIK
jgi:hypothetical protein